MCELTLTHLRRPCAHNHHQVPFSQYVRELLQKGDVTKSVFLVSLIYCYRANKQAMHSTRTDTDTTVDPFACSHCLFLGCLLLASKYCDDEVFLNRDWAKWGLVPVRVLNKIELVLMRTMHFSMHVDTPTFQKWAAWYTDTSRRPGCDYSVSQQLILVVLNLNVLAGRPVPTVCSVQSCASPVAATPDWMLFGDVGAALQPHTPISYTYTPSAQNTPCYAQVKEARRADLVTRAPNRTVASQYHPYTDKRQHMRTAVQEAFVGTHTVYA